MTRAGPRREAGAVPHGETSALPLDLPRHDAPAPAEPPPLWGLKPMTGAHRPEEVEPLARTGGDKILVRVWTRGSGAAGAPGIAAAAPPAWRATQRQFAVWRFRLRPPRGLSGESEIRRALDALPWAGSGPDPLHNRKD